MVIHLLVYLVEQHSCIATKRQVKMTGFCLYDRVYESITINPLFFLDLKNFKNTIYCNQKKK